MFTQKHTHLHQQQLRPGYSVRLLQVTKLNLRKLKQKSQAEPRKTKWKWVFLIKGKLFQKIKACRKALGLHIGIGKCSGVEGMICIFHSSLFPCFHDFFLSVNLLSLMHCPNDKVGEPKFLRVCTFPIPEIIPNWTTISLSQFQVPGRENLWPWICGRHFLLPAKKMPQEMIPTDWFRNVPKSSGHQHRI